LRRPRGRGGRAGRGAGGRHPRPLRRAGRLDHRRARRRGGEARIHEADVLRRGPGADGGRARRRRPGAACQPRQDVDPARPDPTGGGGMSALVAGDLAAVQEAVREGGPLVPVAGGTKTAMHPDPAGDVRALDVSGLTGVVDYDPAELTFTARPGTPLAEIDAM